MYNEYFGFSASPFNATPDPRFFYTTPVYREAFATLQYGIEAKKGFIVVTGEVGTGKTTLLRKLMTENLNGIIHTIFLFNTNLNFTELLQMMICDLGLRATESNKALLLQELNNYLLAQIGEGHIVAALVDEAQNLSDEALEGLRLLSNMETDQEKLIQIVLMGQPELETTLDRPSLRQLKQRIALHCRIAPLREDEVKPYIDFRLRAAGYKGTDLFDSDAVRLLTSYSKGIPRLVNIICDNALLSAFATNQKSICGDIIKEVARDLRLGNGMQQTLDPTSNTVARKSEPAIREQQIEHATEPNHRSATLRADGTLTRAVSVQSEPQTIAARTAPPVHQKFSRRALKLVSTALMIFLSLIAMASFIEPKDFLGRAGKTLSFAKRNLNQWVVFVSNQEPVPEQATAAEKVTIEPKIERITIPRGSSVYQVAGQMYGANSNLGIDLIGEFNPDIKNLGKVSAGQTLILPALTLETLLRKHSDGSYDLILASFRRELTAAEYAKRLEAKGYSVTITPRKIADDLLLHRLEISGLKTVEEVNQTWLTALRNEWLSLPG